MSSKYLLYFSIQIGFNSAHNSFPHITLLSGKIKKTLAFKVDFLASSSTGLTVCDSDVETVLEKVKIVADNFAREFANHGHVSLSVLT